MSSSHDSSSSSLDRSNRRHMRKRRMAKPKDMQFPDTSEFSRGGSSFGSSSNQQGSSSSFCACAHRLLGRMGGKMKARMTMKGKMKARMTMKAKMKARMTMKGKMKAKMTKRGRTADWLLLKGMGGNCHCDQGSPGPGDLVLGHFATRKDCEDAKLTHC